MATQAPTAESFDVGRLIARGVAVIGRQFVPFAVLSILLVGLPTFLIQFFVLGEVSKGNFTFFFSGTWALGLLVSFLSAALLQAALVRASIRDLLEEPVEVVPNLVEALRLLLPVIAVSLLYGLMAILGMLLLIVPGIMIYIAFIVSIPVLVEERQGIIGSLKRSAELTRGSRWWIFLMLILLILVSSVIGGIFALANAPFLAASRISLAIVQTASSTVTGLVSAAMLASLYAELRLIKEGARGESLAAIFS